MSNEIIVALIMMVGSWLGSWSGFKLTAYRVEQLEKKVDKHNNFAMRMPVVEEKISRLEHLAEEKGVNYEKIQSST